MIQKQYICNACAKYLPGNERTCIFTAEMTRIDDSNGPHGCLLFVLHNDLAKWELIKESVK